MEILRKAHLNYLNQIEDEYQRELIDEVDWNERLLFIKGPRGIGKTTMILQYIKKNYGTGQKALYVSMDNLNLSNFSLFEIAEYHWNHGGRHLFIDEIHKYENWSQELKNIYDSFKKLKVTVSGSSLLEIYKGKADLSRRAVSFDMPGLSFREFVEVEKGIRFKKLTFQDILSSHLDLTNKIAKNIDIIPLFKSYLSYGYYPFYLEGIKSFHQKLNNTIQLTLEADLGQLFNMDAISISKLKKLIYHIATNVPFIPNITKLAGSLELTRQTLYHYLYLLNEARIILPIWENSKSYRLMAKPDKLYLNNTNLSFIFEHHMVNSGSLRETFFANQLLNAKHTVLISCISDFTIDNKYTFEIGGANKTTKQIRHQKNAFVALDDHIHGYDNHIPLWLFGFLY